MLLYQFAFIALMLLNLVMHDYLCLFRFIFLSCGVKLSLRVIGAGVII